MRGVILITLVSFLVSPPGYAQASDRESESKIIVLERLLRVEALASKDLSVLSSFLSEEIVLVRMDGRTQKKAEFIAELESGAAMRCTVADVVVRIHGRTATATGLFEISGVERGKPFLRRGRFLDTWLNQSRLWFIIASLSVPARDGE